MMPVLSVVIAVRDRRSMLEAAVSSAMSQVTADDEILIVDDGSSDATKQWLDEVRERDPRIRVVTQPPSGVAAARRRGLLEARRDFVCVLDSDDKLLPGALERIRVALAHEHADLVYGWYREWSRRGGFRVIQLPSFDDNKAMLRQTLVRPRVPFKHSGTTFDRNVGLKLGVYDQSLVSKIDVDLYLRFLRAGRRLTLIREALVEFCRHPASMSSDRLAGLRSWFTIIDRYGPESKMERAAVKCMRATAEGAKLLAQYIGR